MASAEHILRVRRLYKLIFRVHRGLPAELRVLGDNYARDEFKRHKTCNMAEANVFLNEWTVSLLCQTYTIFINVKCYIKL